MYVMILNYLDKKSMYIHTCWMSDVGCRMAPISFRKNPCCSIEKLVTRTFATYKSEFVYFRD